MTGQMENPELTKLMSSHFVRRDDPDHALINTMGIVKTRLGFLSSWFASDFNETGQMRNQNGVDAPLTHTGFEGYSYDVHIPYLRLLGDRAYTAVTHNITGAETFIDFSYRGLSLAGFFRIENEAGTDAHILGKWNITGNLRSYRLKLDTNQRPVFEVSIDGTAIVGITSSVVLAANQWCFFCGRYDPSTGLYLQVNDTVDQNTTGVPATVFTSGATGISIAEDYGGNQTAEIDFSWGAVWNVFQPDSFPFMLRELSYPVYKS